MHVDQLRLTGAIVEIVDVLRHHQRGAAMFAGQAVEGMMCGVALDRRVAQLDATRIVESVDALGIAGKGLRCRYVLDADPGPQPSGSRNVARPLSRLIPAPVRMTMSGPLTIASALTVVGVRSPRV